MAVKYDLGLSILARLVLIKVFGFWFLLLSIFMFEEPGDVMLDEFVQRGGQKAQRIWSIV